MFVPLKDIAVVNRQRKVMDPQALRQLANSILAVGRLIHPINVRPTQPGEVYPDDYSTVEQRGQPIQEPWVLLTGGRRLAAHMVIGKDEIEARNFEDLPPLEREIVELEENVARADITWQEKLEAEARIHALRHQQAVERGEAPPTLTKTAEEIGMSKANLSKDLTLHAMMKVDPSLASAPTKKAALRKAAFKTEINRRIQSIKQVDLGDLRSKLFTADMRDFIRTIGDDSVDLHFSDFPFGIDYDITGHNAATQKGHYRDDPNQIRDLLADTVSHMVRTVKPTGWIVAMMGWSNYGYLSGLFRCACKVHHGYADPSYTENGMIVPAEKKCNARKGDKRPCRFLEVEELPWVWYRPNSRQPSLWPELHANNQYEMICVVNGGSAKLVTPNVGNVLAIDADYNDRIHEMQRPHALCIEIIRRTTVTGELVVDLCFGSGAHLAAAADLGRDFRGCDISPDNLGPALSHVAQYYKGKHVMQAIKGGATPAPGMPDDEDEVSDEDAKAMAADR